MIDIATTSVTSAASPAAFFDRWADMATWPEWSLDTEWVRLDGPFVQGATGTLKPKGGPKVRFVVESLIPEREFVDVSRLAGTRLSFAHYVAPTVDGGCTVSVRITMSGPLARLWDRILGKGLRSSAKADLERLAHVAEAAHSASG
ncbi:MAG: SRPBCC family protein [Nocardioidaceae bacterium]|nr:SRPBCC family protein [Nocardioidaceae bacterium]